MTFRSSSRLNIFGFLLTIEAICGPGVLSNAPLELQENCTDVSEEVDKWLDKSNKEIATEEAQTLTAGDFEKSMRLHFLGIQLPLNVHMEASDGLLSSMDHLQRISPVFMCGNSTISHTSGLFQYRKMQMSYKHMRAKFLFWEIEGNFTYEFEPRINLVVKKSTIPGYADCGPGKPLTLESTGSTDYVIETADDSWRSWFLKKVLHRALAGDGKTPMIKNFLDRAWVSIDCYYCEYSC